MNIADSSRDCGLVFWNSVTNPLAGVVTRSPIFYCGDDPDYAGSLGTAAPVQPIQQVRGPSVDIFLKVQTASAGATIALLGSPTSNFTASGITVLTASGAVAGTYPFPALLAAMAASAPKTFNSPYPYWMVVYTNGASNQAAGWAIAVRAGGYS